MDGVSPTGDELTGAGGRLTVVAPGVSRLIEVPGRPGAVLTNAKVDAHALGKVCAAGPGEARNEEAVDLKRISQEGGVGLRVGRSGQDGGDPATGCQCRERRDAVAATRSAGSLGRRRRCLRTVRGVVTGTRLSIRAGVITGTLPSIRPGVVETRLGDIGGLSAGGGQVEDLHRGGTVGLAGGASTMTGAAARVTGVTDLRCGDGHGDQTGQKERGQSGQPDSTVNGADTRTRDFHGVPLEVTASRRRSSLTTAAADADPSGGDI